MASSVQIHLVIGCTAINILLREEQIVLTEAVMAARGTILNTHQIYLISLILYIRYTTYINDLSHAEALQIAQDIFGR